MISTYFMCRDENTKQIQWGELKHSYSNTFWPFVHTQTDFSIEHFPGWRFSENSALQFERKLETGFFGSSL